MFKKISNWFKLQFNRLTFKLRVRKTKVRHQKNFKNTFGISHKKIKSVMNKLDNTQNTDMSDTRLSELIRGRKGINQIKNKSPFFYEPEIIDIHNEDVYGRVGLSIDDLKIRMNKEDEILLDDQKKILEHLERTNQTRIFNNLYGRYTRMNKR